MKGPKFSISKRIAAGYFSILLISLIASVISIFTLQDSRRQYSEIEKVYLPMVGDLKDFKNLSKESNKLITNWIYIANRDEKERIKILHTICLPGVKESILNSLKNSDKNDNSRKEITTMLAEEDKIIAAEEKIMHNLSSEQAYNDDKIIDASIHLLDKVIQPSFKENQSRLSVIVNKENAFLKVVEKKLSGSYDYLTLILVGLLFFIFVVGILGSLFAIRSVSRPISSLKDIVLSLGKGEIPHIAFSGRKDEIGEMANAITLMADNIKLKTKFASLTGKGNYENQLELLSNNDVLGLALIKMRDNLKHKDEADAARNWINAGLAKTGEVMKINGEEGGKLYNRLISFLATYLNAHSAGLYLSDYFDNGKDKLELVASYAYYGNNAPGKKIHFGEGLAGQAAIDKEILVINDVPENYIRINSGLGENVPRCLVILPLLFENEVKGVIELAMNKQLSATEHEFIVGAAKIISITLDLLQRKSRSEVLLEESIKLNTQLQTSEEELRTTNEELSTFVYRTAHDLKGPIASILGLINTVDNEVESEDGKMIFRMVKGQAEKLDVTLRMLSKTMAVKGAPLNIEPIDFKYHIDNILDKMHNLEYFHSANVMVNVYNIKQFSSDHEVVEYILQNLIENAIKFQDKNKAERTIRINVFDYEGGVKMEISDNGIGIDSNSKARVFDMFFRANAHVKGIGLGLYLVKHSVGKLKGHIDIHSEEGIGTTFSVYIPDLSFSGLRLAIA
jgi:signal transduction histidine kinase/HAMP domain-containing protein